MRRREFMRAIFAMPLVVLGMDSKAPENSSVPQDGAVYQVIHLSKEEARSFLGGNKVITIDDARGNGKNSQMFWRHARVKARRQVKLRG